MSRHRAATMPSIDISRVPRITLGPHESTPNWPSNNWSFNYWYADSNREDKYSKVDADGDDEDSVGITARSSMVRPRSFRQPNRPKNVGVVDVKSKRAIGMSSTPHSREASPGRELPSLHQVLSQQNTHPSYPSNSNSSTSSNFSSRQYKRNLQEERALIHAPAPPQTRDRDDWEFLPGSRVVANRISDSDEQNLREMIGKVGEMKINRPDRLGFAMPTALPSHVMSGTVAPAPSPAGVCVGLAGRGGGVFTFGNRLIVPLAEPPLNTNANSYSTSSTAAAPVITTSPTGNKGPPKSPKSPTAIKTSGGNKSPVSKSKFMFPLPPLQIPIGEDSEMNIGHNNDPQNSNFERSASFSERVRRFESTRHGGVVNRGDAIRRGSGPPEPTPMGLHRLTKIALGLGYGGMNAGGQGLSRISPNRSPTGPGSVSCSVSGSASASASGSARGSGNIQQALAVNQSSSKQTPSKQTTASAAALSKIEAERQDAFYVQVLGGEGVGKSSLCMQLQTSEYVGDRDPGTNFVYGKMCSFPYMVHV